MISKNGRLTYGLSQISKPRSQSSRVSAAQPLVIFLVDPILHN